MTWERAMQHALKRKMAGEISDRTQRPIEVSHIIEEATVRYLNEGRYVKLDRKSVEYIQKIKNDISFLFKQDGTNLDTATEDTGEKIGMYDLLRWRGTWVAEYVATTGDSYWITRYIFGNKPDENMIRQAERITNIQKKIESGEMDQVQDGVHWTEKTEKMEQSQDADVGFDPMEDIKKYISE